MPRMVNPASSMRARILPALRALTASGLMMAKVRSTVISKEVYTRGEFKGAEVPRNPAL